MNKCNRLYVALTIVICLIILTPATTVSQILPVDISQRIISTEIVQDSHLEIYVADTDTRILVASVDLDEVHPGFLDMISLSPDQRKIVYVTNPKSLDDASVWIAQTDGSGSKKIATLGDKFWIVPPVWSPNSDKLAYVLLERNGVGTSGIELWTMNADGSSQTQLIRDPSFTANLFVGNPADVIHWTKDDTHIQYTDYKTIPPIVYEVDIKSGNVKSRVSTDLITTPKTGEGSSILTLPCSVTLFSQRDPDFQPELYTASCLGNYTMASGGCAITSLAMMLKYYGVNTNPRILDDTLGSSRCPLSNHWAEVATVGGVGSDVSYVGAWDGSQWSMLQNDLANGKPVVVRMFRSSDNGNHYVLAINGSGSSPSNYTIADPWDGATKSMQNYYNTGYYFAGLIRYSGTPHCQQDTTAPTTSPSLSGTSGENGWYTSDVQVSLTASDNSGGSGVDQIEYKINDGSWQTYAEPFTISGEGRHTVYYKAQDKAGNWESQKQVSVSIDATAPTGSVALDDGVASTPGVLIHVQTSATDATSGLYQLRLRDAGETWGAWQAYTGRLRWQLPAVTGQSHTVEVQIKDVAGNVSTTYADEILLDIYPERPASTGYRLTRSTWGAAPKDGQSTNYRLRGTAGQPSLIGDVRSTHYRLLSGYWSGQGRAGAMHRVYLPMVVRR